MADKEIKVKATPINQVEIKGAIAFSAEHSRVWAEGTDEEVEKLGGEHSAKVWSRIVPDEAKTYTDEQIVLAKTELTGQINTASQGSVQTANSYTDTQLAAEASARQNADDSLQIQIDELNLTDLNDVDVSSPSDAQVLAYDTNTQKWKNSSSTASVAWGGVTGTLSNQTDLQSALDAKQETISDLETISSGAALGATAVQPGDLAAVATSGAYGDLIGAPIIPTVDQTYSASSTNAQSGVAVASAINGKADTDLGNVPASKGILVESYVNGTSWYRVWSDGWCEQGGLSAVIPASGGLTITFLKPMANTDYSVYAGVMPNSSTAGDSRIFAINRTTSSMELDWTKGDYADSTWWKVEGYIS